VPQGSNLPTPHSRNIQRRYYVDAVNGSDSFTEAQARDNPSQPWATLQKAADTYALPASGDVSIDVRPTAMYQAGSGAATMIIDRGVPTTSQWLIVRKDPDYADSEARPLVRIAAGTTGIQKDAFQVGDAFVILDGFEIDSSGRPGDGTAGADGTGVYRFGGVGAVELWNLHIHDLILVANAASKVQGVFSEIGQMQMWNLHIHDIGATTEGEAANDLEHGMYLQGDDYWLINSLIYDITNGFAVQSYEGGPTFDSHRVVHCTLALATDQGLWTIDPRNSTNIICRNTIFYSSVNNPPISNGQGSAPAAEGAGSLDRLLIDKVAASVDITNPAHFRLGSIDVDSPIDFVDVTNRDFRLNQNSAGRRFADSSWSPAFDMNNRPRREGQEDCGALQTDTTPVENSHVVLDKESHLDFTSSNSWTHTPVGVPECIVVFIAHGSAATDVISEVTYGGVAMARVPLGFAADTLTEPGAVYCYILFDPPSGDQTVSVTVASGTVAKTGWAFSLYSSDGSGLSLVDSKNVEQNIANPSVQLGTPTDFDGFMMGCIYSGVAAPDTCVPKYVKSVYQRDFGAFVATCQHGRATGPDQTIGWTVGSDDTAVVGIALAPVPATNRKKINYQPWQTRFPGGQKIRFIQPPGQPSGEVGPTEYLDAATVSLALTPSSTDVADYVDSDTELLALTPSATEERQQYDADTQYLTLLPSGSDIAEFVDSDTELLKLTPSGTDIADYVDSDTERVALTPSSDDIADYVDSDTELFALTPSATDVAEFVDSDTELFKLTPSGTDEYTPGAGGTEYTDSGTQYLALLPSGTDIAEFVDSDTELFKFTPSSTDIADYVDANTELLTLLPSSADIADYVDSDIELFKFTPSSADIAEFVDTDIGLLKFTPSGTDIADYADTNVGLLIFTPSSVDIAEFIDSALELFVLTPGGTESLGGNIDEGTLNLRLIPILSEDIYFPFDTLLVGELQNHYTTIVSTHYTTEFVSRWFGMTLNRKWSGVTQDRKWVGAIEQSRAWLSDFLGKRFPATFKGRGEP
jgi:hypothetical protein